MFKAQVEYAPYFYLQVKVGGWLGRWVVRVGGCVACGWLQMSPSVCP